MVLLNGVVGLPAMVRADGMALAVRYDTVTYGLAEVGLSAFPKAAFSFAAGRFVCVWVVSDLPVSRAEMSDSMVVMVVTSPVMSEMSWVWVTLAFPVSRASSSPCKPVTLAMLCFA